MILPLILVCLFAVTDALAWTLGAQTHQSGWFMLRWFGAPVLPALITLLLIAVAAGLLLGSGWLLFQVLCLQGRLLLRLEVLEARRPSSSKVSHEAAEDSKAASAPLVAEPIAALAPLLAPGNGRRGEGLVFPAEEEEEIDLTIGMATYHDFDGVYFTLQALRLYQDLNKTELLVIDNYGCEATKNLVEGWLHGRYIRATDVTGTAAPRDLVFRHARGKAVLCCDSHILFAPGAIARLKQFYQEHPRCQDLLQGPLLYDDGRNIATHFVSVWREQMWGVWATDARGLDPEGEPFDIPMQGLGVFSCRKDAWLGFHPQFRGFGGEEGYIHEKFRQVGRRCLCLPWFRWMHRFGRPAGVKYPLTIEDKLRNYVLGHAELGLDLAPVLEHFAQHLPQERVQAIEQQALAELGASVSPRSEVQMAAGASGRLAHDMPGKRG